VLFRSTYNFKSSANRGARKQQLIALLAIRAQDVWLYMFTLSVVSAESFARPVTIHQ